MTARLVEISVHDVIQRLREAGHVQSSQKMGDDLPGSVRPGIVDFMLAAVQPELDRLRRELEHVEAGDTSALRLGQSALNAWRQQHQQLRDRVRAAVHIADDEDITDWQHGYRACAEHALHALNQTTQEAS